MSDPTDTESTFLADIAEDPEDDVPRLIFADWLSDHGDPRGEFIRIQCKVTRLPDSAPNNLHAQEQALLLQHGSTWQGDPPPGVGIWFERGLLNVTMSVHLALDHTTQTWLRRQQRWVIGLRFYDCDTTSLWRVVEAGLLANVPQLDFSFTRVDDQAAEFLWELRSLRGLHLGHTSLTDTGLARLAMLTHLRSLILSGTRITDAGLGHLAALRQLRRLSLRETTITSAGLSTLGCLSRLETLDLTATPVTNAAIKELRRSLPRLRVVR